MAITIQQFFTSYLDAFRRQNVAVISSFFAVPCMVADGETQRVLATPVDVERYVEELLAAYAEQGLTAERITVRSLLLLGDEFAVSNLAWSMLGGNRNLKTFHTAYNVRRSQGNWSIWAVTAHERIKD